MGRGVNLLSARKVQSLTAHGRHADGGGLYLVVDDRGKRWILLYRIAGKRREMGLGSLTSVSLAAAREAAAAARALVAGGVDPIEARRAPPEEAVRPTFAVVAEAYMSDREATWRSAIHRRQWRQTLEEHGAHIWSMQVDHVDTDAVLTVLRPLWQSRPETARRLRGRIERILDAARVQGHRAGENPARWTGHLSLLLPAPKRLTRGHHAAMPYQDVPAFVARLRARQAPSASALEYLILTAARSGEVRGMTWGEVDLAGALWTVPAARMKAKRPHRVPLSRRALDILQSVRLGAHAPDDLVFPSRRGTVSSDMIYTALLKRMGHGDITAHGFRSSFRDWAADETDHPREVIEAALAHLVGDETERAYRRGDALQKRRQLLDDWAAFVSSACKSS